MAKVRAEFWGEVRQKTWVLSKEHFQWLYPVAAGGFALLVVWLIQGRQELMDNAVPLVAAGIFAIFAAVVVYVNNFIRATNEVVNEMRKAPYDEGLGMRTEIKLDTVVLHVRHRIETGFFSAQLWMMNGGVPLATPNASLAWSDTASPRRVLVHGEDHALKLMRFEVTQEEGEQLISVEGFICGPSGVEQRTPVMGEHVGRDYFRAHPIILHLNVTDSAEQMHRVQVRIDLKASKAKHATLSAHLVREC